MALLTPQSPTITGITPTYATSTASDTVKYVGGRSMYVHCKNTAGAPNTMTIVVPGTEFGQQNPDIPITVPATTGDKLIGPLPAKAADPATGLITLTNSAPAAGVTMAIFLT